MTKDASLRAFKCPSCGAPLEPEVGTLTMKCQYCGGTVIIPESLRTPTPKTGPSMGDMLDFGLQGVDLGQIMGNAMQLPQAIQLAKQGQIDEAANIYSQITGMEHADAVESVKAMAAGHAVSLTPGRPGTSWQTGQPSVPISSVSTATTFSSSSFSTTPSTPAARSSKGGRSCGLLVGIIAGVVALIIFLVAGGVFFFSKGSVLKALGPIGFASKTLSFGSEGIGQGQFEDARSLGVDGAGNITTVDYSDGRVQTFDPSGKFLSGFNISPDGKKVYVTSMAVGRNGDIYLTTGINIMIYDGKGNKIGELGDTDHRYSDVALGGDGKLYAIENDETIVRFKPDLSIDLEVPDTFTNAAGDMEIDSHVAADGLGNMYILGGFHYLVLKFSPDGKYVNRFGGEAKSPSSNEPGKLSTPRAIVTDGYGRIYVSDFFDVKVYDSDGTYVNVVSPAGGPFGLAVDSANSLYMMTTDKRVEKYSVQKPAGE